MKKIKITALVLVLLLVYGQTPSAQWLKSLVVMSVYSTYEASHSVLEDTGIRVRIPGGNLTTDQDWYPFVITFNDDRGFSRYTGRDLRMTVLYNFGYFPWWRSWSSYYDVDSPYYNSFYGAYAVQVAEGQAFGFPQGQADIREMGLVPTYDMERLVLISIGHETPVFEYEVTNQGPCTLFGEDDWYVFDADMTLSGAYHTYEKDYRAYIQYGRPPVLDTGLEDYELVEMKGRIYGKYYEDRGVSLFFYCIAAEQEVIDNWEGQIMSETKLIFW